MTLTLLLCVWSIANTNFSHLVYLQDAPHGTLLTFSQFVSIWPASMSLIALGVLAVLGGAYIVPLYTLLQTHTPLTVRARMVAVNNIMNAFLMVLSALLLMVGFALNLSLMNMLFILALLNTIVMIFVFKKRFIGVE